MSQSNLQLLLNHRQQLLRYFGSSLSFKEMKVIKLRHLLLQFSLRIFKNFAILCMWWESWVRDRCVGIAPFFFFFLDVGQAIVCSRKKPHAEKVWWQTFYRLLGSTLPESISFYLIGPALRVSSRRQAFCSWQQLAACIGCNRKQLQRPLEGAEVVGPCFPDQPSFPWPSFMYSQLLSILV